MADRPTAMMLPRENGEKMVIITPSNGKVLIREDTLMANMNCVGCGRSHFTCGGVKKQWSALCWGKRSDRKYYCLLSLLLVTFVVSIVGTIFFCTTNTVNNLVIYNMVIRNNSISYSMWRRPSVTPTMKVYLFNYTNWRDVKNGDAQKLHVEEVGPYVYSQHMERVNIKFEGDTLAYQEKNDFKFLPEKSKGAHFDQVTVPNLPLLGVASITKDFNSISMIPISGVLQWANHPDAFVQLPVQRFLWGYYDSIIQGVKPLLSLQGKLNFDEFGLLVMKNGTSSDRLMINTGAKDINKMNMVQKLNGDSQMKIWGSAECNSVEGSDGTIFPTSLLDRTTTLNIIFPNLCRRLPFHYEKDVELPNGVNLLRYRLPKNVFDDPAHNPENQCYCEIDTATCPPRGLINVTACNMGAPALVSFPHFYLGDPALREQITGLKPDPIKHDSYIDIHPTLGISLNGKSALQLNVQVRKSPMFTSLHYLKQDLILPIAWIDMTVEEIPQDIQNLVYHGTYSTVAVQLGLIVTCIVALIISGVCLLIMFVRRRRKPCAVFKVPESEFKSQGSAS